MRTKTLIKITLITFILKIFIAFYLVSLGSCPLMAEGPPSINAWRVGLISFAGGDTDSYLGAMDNYLENGQYYFWSGERNVYAGRMPYYGIPYFILRLFFKKTTAGDILVIIQLFFSSIGTVLIGAIGYRIHHTKLSFALAYFLSFLSLNYFALDLILITESLALSFLIIFLYLYHIFLKSGETKTLLTANIFLCLTVLLKPYLVLIYIPLFVSLYFKKDSFKNENFSSRAKQLTYNYTILALPLILALAPWIVRNALVLNKLVLTQESMTAGYDYKESFFAYRRFISAWGGDSVFSLSQRRNPTYYFLLEQKAIHDSIEFPREALSAGYSQEDVEDVRNHYLKLQEEYSPELDELVRIKFDRLTEIYRNENPFMFYVGSGFVALKRFVIHTNSQNILLFIDPRKACYKSWLITLRVINSTIYLLSISFGTIGILRLLIKGKLDVVFISIPIILVLFFCFYFKHVEARYFTHGFPVFIIGLTSFLITFFGYCKSLTNRFVIK